MMGSAQLEVLPEDESVFTLEPAAAAQPSALKLEVAEKLAAHRQRRARAQMTSAAEVAQTSRRGEVKHRVAAAVAERYAQTPSYRAFLAEEAERAIQQAAAAAVVAKRNAEAVAAVQQELLAELEKWDAPQKFNEKTAEVISKPLAPVAVPVKQVSAAGLTVRLYEDVGRPRAAAATPNVRAGEARASEHEAQALEDEIAFRQAPVFEEFHPVEPSTPLPANLLAFPRQLVATVKARPSLALGPLRDEDTRGSQLRIFEVAPELLATEPEPISLIPEWSTIWLDAHVVTEPTVDPDTAMPDLLPSLLPPQTAALHLRAMAWAVDSVVVLGAYVAFLAAFAHFAGAIELGIPLAVAAVAVLASLYFAYQMLFFTLSDQTPGMRYARIGLCTFSDENPSRKAMRKRVLAQVVAVAPLGLGVAWILLDDDRLGWHDRMSRMYQRAY